MRILNIIASVNPKGGGVIAWVLQFSKTAISFGHSVDILSMDAHNAKWINNYPVPVYTVGNTAKGYYSNKLVPWLINNANNYDLIIIHGLWRYSSYGAWRALNQLNTPYFVYTHGMLDPWFKENYPVKHAGKSIYWPLTDYKVLRDAQGVIFTAKQEQIKAKKSFLMYKTRNEYVCPIGIEDPENNGLDATKENTFFNKYPHLINNNILLFLGRIHEKKGCDILLRAFSAIKNTYPDLHLVMAGPYEEKYYTTLTSMPEYRLVQNEVTWTGMLTGKLKWDAYQACGAFILPSHQENFGISVVEALACAKPVIISNKVDIWQEINEYNAGFITHDTIESVKNGIMEWLTCSDEQNSQMSLNARCCYQNNFTLDSAVNKVLRVFSKTLNKDAA